MQHKEEKTNKKEKKILQKKKSDRTFNKQPGGPWYTFHVSPHYFDTK